MADHTFRSFRSRDSLPPSTADVPADAQYDDPLAELARLIGQNNAMTYRNDADQGVAADPAAAELADRRADARYEEAPPAYRPAPPTYDTDYDPPAPSESFALPPLPPSVAPRQATYQQNAPAAYPEADRGAPAEDYQDDFQDAAADERYDGETGEYLEDDDAEAEYAQEDAEEERGGTKRRSGFAFVATIIGLAVLGTACAFAYRTMFGSSMVAVLPPIIKADDTPSKIVPNGAPAKTNAAGAPASGNGPNGQERIVSREEAPVQVPTPTPATTPRVVSTIPVYADNSSGMPAAVSQAAAAMSQQQSPVPGGSAPAAVAAGVAAAAAQAAPAAPMQAPTQVSPPAAPPSGAPTTEPKKIHTVSIHTDTAAQSAAAAAAPHAVASRPVASAPVSPSVAGGNAPLSIVPNQGDTAAGPAPTAPRTRMAVARPAAEPVSAGGGYAVQVTSQRSEAEAQSAYHALQARYPSQLGGTAPIIHKADLGAKGVFYRALVGPYASMEQAASVCSSLKAAGGSCIVQRN
jgi:hypothetical protein